MTPAGLALIGESSSTNEDPATEPRGPTIRKIQVSVTSNQDPGDLARAVVSRLASNSKPESAQPRCSFCGKTRDAALVLVAGPCVYICDACVDMCFDIVAEWREQPAVPAFSDPGPDLRREPLFQPRTQMEARPAREALVRLSAVLLAFRDIDVQALGRLAI